MDRKLNFDGPGVTWGLLLAVRGTGGAQGDLLYWRILGPYTVWEGTARLQMPCTFVRSLGTTGVYGRLIDTRGPIRRPEDLLICKDGLYQGLHTNTIPNTILDKNY